MASSRNFSGTPHGGLLPTYTRRVVEIQFEKPRQYIQFAAKMQQQQRLPPLRVYVCIPDAACVAGAALFPVENTMPPIGRSGFLRGGCCCRRLVLEKIFFPSLSLLRSGSSSHCRPADALSYNRRRVIPLLAICIPRGSCAKRSSLSLSREGEVGEKGSGGAAAGGERERERERCNGWFYCHDRFFYGRTLRCAPPSAFSTHTRANVSLADVRVYIAAATVVARKKRIGRTGTCRIALYRRGSPPSTRVCVCGGRSVAEKKSILHPRWPWVREREREREREVYTRPMHRMQRPPPPGVHRSLPPPSTRAPAFFRPLFFLSAARKHACVCVCAGIYVYVAIMYETARKKSAAMWNNRLYEFSGMERIFFFFSEPEFSGKNSSIL